jgi:putative SOS response-associated peptidase YedK
VNARGETVNRLPSFREAFERRRCIIPATGFYEWEKVGKARIPHLFRSKAGGILGFAPGCGSGGEKGRTVVSCTIVTTTANEVVRPLRERMPVVLSPDDYESWMADETSVEEAAALLRPANAGLLEVVLASPIVNSVKNEWPQCAVKICLSS